MTTIFLFVSSLNRQTVQGIYGGMISYGMAKWVQNIDEARWSYPPACGVPQLIGPADRHHMASCAQIQLLNGCKSCKHGLPHSTMLLAPPIMALCPSVMHWLASVSLGPGFQSKFEILQKRGANLASLAIHTHTHTGKCFSWVPIDEYDAPEVEMVNHLTQKAPQTCQEQQLFLMHATTTLLQHRALATHTWQRKQRHIAQHVVHYYR